MWGGVDAETSGSTNAVWGSASGGGNHESGNWSGPTTSKSGWDTQQSLVTATSGGTGAGWQSSSSGHTPVTSNPVTTANGWSAASGTATSGSNSWNTNSAQQQWTGGNSGGSSGGNGGGSSWACVASRGATTTNGGVAAPQQNATSIHDSNVPTQTSAVRPKQQSSGNSGIASIGAASAVASGWGKPVEQGTPWDVSGATASDTSMNSNTGSLDSRSNDTSTNAAPMWNNSSNSVPSWTEDFAPDWSKDKDSGKAMWDVKYEPGNTVGHWLPYKLDIVKQTCMSKVPIGDWQCGSGENEMTARWEGAANKEAKPLVGNYQPNSAERNAHASSGQMHDKSHHAEPVGENRTPTGWDSQPGSTSRQSSNNHDSDSSRKAESQSQMRDSVSNVWTGPPGAQDSGSMVWRNPYPKKPTPADRGTNVWGDPTSQGDIKRWKANNEGDLLPAVPAPSNAQQATSGACSANPSNSGIQQSNSSGWQDTTSPNAPPSKNNDPPTTASHHNAGSGWRDSQLSSGSVAKTPHYDSVAKTPSYDSVAKTPSYDSVAKTPNYDRDGIATAGWCMPGGKHADPTRASVESEGGNASDDVFSSHPTTPLSAGVGHQGANAGNQLLINKQETQLPNGFGHVGGATNPQMKIGMVNAQNTAGLLSMNSERNAVGGDQRVALQVLTQQIADQLRGAVRAGLVDIDMLNQVLPQTTLRRLSEMLQLMSKHGNAKKEIGRLQTLSSEQGLTPAQEQELHKLTTVIMQLDLQIPACRNQIRVLTANAGKQPQQPQPQPHNGSAVPNQRTASASANGDNGQSKLDQWKRGASNGASSSGDANGIITEQQEQLTGVAGNCGSGSAVFGVGLPSSSNDPWSNTPAKRNSGTVWPMSTSCLSKSPDKDNDSIKDNENITGLQNSGDNREMTPKTSGANADNSVSNNGPNLLLDDVPEFKPGERWNWRDPKELAADPDATPGSVKKPALSAVNAMLNTDFFGGANLGQSGAGGLAGAVGNMNLGGGAMLGGGYPNFGMTAGALPQNFYSQTTPTKNSPYDMSKVASGAFGNAQQNLNDNWSAGGNPRVSRPPSQIGQPIGGRPPYKHSMSSPNPTAFMSYNNNYGPPAQWVVLTNLNMIDEPTLQMMVSRAGPVATCAYPPASGFAVVKFNDVSLDKILPRLQQECSALGITIQLAKDEEVTRLIQAVTGHRAAPMGMQMNNGQMYGPPMPPPPHHPAMPAMWEAPPPHQGGPWGGPPPSSNMHHPGGAGNFGPHHALADPTVAAAAAAMSMNFPPGKHDGLWR